MAFKIGDRVVRKSNPEADTGTIKDAWPGFDRVRVKWDASGRSSLINVAKLKYAPPILPKDDSWKQVFQRGNQWAETEDGGPKIYPDLASAQEAMDRGETVRIAMQPSEINPAIVQLAQDLQDKERMEEWRFTNNLARYFEHIAENLQALASDLELDLSTVHEIEIAGGLPNADGKVDEWWVHMDIGQFAEMWRNYQGRCEVAFSGWHKDYEDMYSSGSSDVAV